MGDIGALAPTFFNIGGGQYHAIPRHEIGGLQFLYLCAKQDIPRCKEQKFTVADRKASAAADDLVNIAFALGHIANCLTV